MDFNVVAMLKTTMKLSRMTLIHNRQSVALVNRKTNPINFTMFTSVSGLRLRTRGIAPSIAATDEDEARRKPSLVSGGKKEPMVESVNRSSQNPAPTRQQIQTSRKTHGVKYFSNFQSKISSQLVAGRRPSLFARYLSIAERFLNLEKSAEVLGSSAANSSTAGAPAAGASDLLIGFGFLLIGVGG